MPTPEPLLHQTTKADLERILHRPPHALLLSGPAGLGKTTVARWLAAQLLHINLNKLNSYPHLLLISSADGKAISIETVRQLEHVLSLKVASDQAISRIIIISDAHLLTTEAQNALLKTLEEPPAGTVIILTAPNEQALLPTIRSRLQSVQLLPPTRAELHQLLSAKSLSEAEIVKILALSGGLPGVAMALAANDQAHPLVEAAQIARQLLQQSTFEKLCQVDTLAKNRQTSQNLTYILQQMAHAALLTGKATVRWQKVLAATYQAEAAMGQGGQPKLILTNLMLNL